MNNIISYLKILGIFIISILLISLFSALINYISPLKLSTLHILDTILMVILFFTLGFKIGKKSSKNGWLVGSVWGIIFVVILLLLSLIFFFKNINISSFIYYAILILTTIFGSVFGINKKKDTN